MKPATNTKYQRPKTLLKAGSNLVLLGMERTPPVVDCYVVAADNLHCLEKKADELQAAFDAARAFIQSHVSDPDQSDEMCRTYAEYLKHRQIIDNQER
jgi:hypothetical protein